VLVADTADYDLILGFTELQKLKPIIRWETGQLEFKISEQERPPRDLLKQQEQQDYP
jgi:hypothetical protein